MEKDTTDTQVMSMTSRDVLSDILRQGAQQMLAMAVENEVGEYIGEYQHVRDANGRRLVVRNGHLPARVIQTGIGLVEVQQPRVNDKRIDQDGQPRRFCSKILPPYLRRTKSIDELIPWLYLRGISTGDFSEALQALLGPQAKGLSGTNVVRLKESWQQEYATWSKRSLAIHRLAGPIQEMLTDLWLSGLWVYLVCGEWARDSGKDLRSTRLLEVFCLSEFFVPTEF